MKHTKCKTLVSKSLLKMAGKVGEPRACSESYPLNQKEPVSLTSAMWITCMKRWRPTLDCGGARWTQWTLLLQASSSYAILGYFNMDYNPSWLWEMMVASVLPPMLAIQLHGRLQKLSVAHIEPDSSLVWGAGSEKHKKSCIFFYATLWCSGAPKGTIWVSSIFQVLGKE